MSEFLNSFNDFRRDGLSNPNSIFYMGEDNSPQPMFRDVADVIHKAGGLVFLAHPFEYKFEDSQLKLRLETDSQKEGKIILKALDIGK